MLQQRASKHFPIDVLLELRGFFAFPILNPFFFFFLINLPAFTTERKKENYFSTNKEPEQSVFKLPPPLNKWKRLKNFTSQGNIFHLLVLKCLNYCLTYNIISPVSDSGTRRKNKTKFNIYKRTLIALLQKVL